MTNIMISPNHDSGFSVETVENQVEVFSACVRGWQLDIAEDLIKNNEKAGFAALFIVTSYFEMIGVILGMQGHTKKIRSGVLEVFPELKEENETNSQIANLIYSDLRNGLYHHGLTKMGIVLSRDFEKPFQSQEQLGKGMTLVIHPLLFVIRIREHFNHFCERLRDSKNQELSKSFCEFFSARGVVGVQKSILQPLIITPSVSFSSHVVTGTNVSVDDSQGSCHRWNFKKTYP